MKSGKLTVVIPTYNRANLLMKTLNNIVFQIINANLQDEVCILISDNNSSDTTEDICQMFAEEYPFVFYQKTSTNYGPDYNFLYALMNAKTPYVWLFGDDDLMVGDALSRVIYLIDTFSPGLLVLNYTVSSEKGSKVKRCFSNSREVLEISNEIDFFKIVSFCPTFMGIHVYDFSILNEILRTGFSEYFIGSRMIHFYLMLHILKVSLTEERKVIIYNEPLVEQIGRNNPNWDFIGPDFIFGVKKILKFAVNYLDFNPKIKFYINKKSIFNSLKPVISLKSKGKWSFDDFFLGLYIFWDCTLFWLLLFPIYLIPSCFFKFSRFVFEKLLSSFKNYMSL